MKHLSSIVLAAAVVAAGAVACFKDPTSSLRKGATHIEVTRNAMTLVTGDSLSIQAEVKDDQGNSYDAVGLTWTTDNAAVATVASDTSKPIPYGVFAKAFVLAVGPGGGVAHVTATYGGLTAIVRVLNLPARLTALATPVVSGTARVDTVGVPPVVFSAGDTVTISATAGSNLTFSDTSMVDFGAGIGYIVSLTPTVIKVIAPVTPFGGRPWVTNLNFAGPAEVGNIYIDSLQSDSVLVARPRFYGTISQLGDTMTVAAQAGTKFSSSSVVRFGATVAVPIFEDSVTFRVISPVAYTGQVTVTNVKLGAAVVDSLKSNASYTMAKATFASTTTTNGTLLDTVRVYATGAAKFTTTPAGSVSDVQMNGVAAFVLLRTADSMYVIAKHTSTGPLTITNAKVGTTIISSLSTPGNVIIGPATGEGNEPGNDVRATATVIAFAGAADTITIYGSLDCEDDGTACPGNGDIIDYYQINFAGGAKIKAIVTWYGNGTGGASYTDTNNPDVDVALRDAAANYYGTNTAANGSGSKMPEVMTTTTLAAGLYYIRVMAWLTPAPMTYKIQILRTP